MCKILGFLVCCSGMSWSRVEINCYQWYESFMEKVTNIFAFKRVWEVQITLFRKYLYFLLFCFRLKGVYLENGVLFAYYRQGNLCWNAQTGELIIEEIPNEFEYIPSGKHVIILSQDKMIVKHALSHLITCENL